MPSVDGTIPSLEVDAFRPCGGAEEAAGNVGTFEKVKIEEIRPKEKVSPTPLTPTFMAGTDNLVEKTCGIYKKGEGEVSLCIESVTKWGEDLVQVNGFLENTGRTKLCGLKLDFEDKEKLHSTWPDWAVTNNWETDFKPKQATAVGLTAPARKDGSHPQITVQDFNVCGAVKSNEKPTLIKKDLAEVKNVQTPTPPVGRHLQAEEEEGGILNRLGNSRAEAKALAAADYSKDLPLEKSRPLKAAECGIYTSGTAELTLCIESMVQWAGAVQQVRQEGR